MKPYTTHMVEGGMFHRALVIGSILMPAFVIACAPSSGVTRNDLNCKGIVPTEPQATELSPLESIDAVTLRNVGYLQQVVLTTELPSLTELPPLESGAEYVNVAEAYDPTQAANKSWYIQTQVPASAEFEIPRPKRPKVCVSVYRARTRKDHKGLVPVTSPRYIGLNIPVYP